MKRVASGIAPVISVNRKAPEALHRQIYDAYRAAILGGRLRPGQRVPSTRVLASEIHVSRFPVLNAYDQLLAEGYFETRVGAGTVVSKSLPDQLTASSPPTVTRASVRPSPRRVAKLTDALPPPTRFKWSYHSGAFRVGLIAFDQFPLRLWATLVARHCRNSTARGFHYGHTAGSFALREAVANYLKIARSLHCDPEQVIIVTGSQQALDMSVRVLLDPGSPVWVEEPGYRLARDVLTLAGCRSVPVPVNEEGLNVTLGIKRCPDARAAFVTPSHQFPLGVTMSATRRLQLIEWAQRAGAWILEDDYDSEYRFESHPISSLQGLDNNSRVIYMGTFSKVLFPAIRLGYLVVPPDLVDHFQRVRWVMDLCPTNLYQDVLADFIREGHFARHIRRMRTYYGELRTCMVESLHQELGSMVEVLGDEAGMHVTVILKHGQDDKKISVRAALQGLSLWPLSPSYIGPVAHQGFILGFAGVTKAEIPKAVRKIRNLLVA